MIDGLTYGPPEAVIHAIAEGKVARFNGGMNATILASMMASAGHDVQVDVYPDKEYSTVRLKQPPEFKPRFPWER